MITSSSSWGVGEGLRDACIPKKWKSEKVVLVPGTWCLGELCLDTFHNFSPDYHQMLRRFENFGL